MRPFSRPPVATALTVLLAISGTPAAHADSHGTFTIEDPRITESSGLAASRQHPGVYWTHNDSDDGPYVYAVDSATGKTVATVTLRGIDPRDVEAISIGPDNTIYVADIGDNLGGTWPEVWIYRFPEPKRLADATVSVTRYTVRYEDGPRNAEAVMVHPRTGRVYIASKERKGASLYVAPKRLSASTVNTFTKVAPIDFLVTDGAFAPDGSRLVLRGYFSATAYRWRHDTPKEVGTPRVPLQPQGESVTFTPDGGALMYGSEGRRSRVRREELDGPSLPDSVARQREKDRRDGKSGADSGHRAADEEKRNHTLSLGLGTFLLATALVVLARRFLRRR